MYTQFMLAPTAVAIINASYECQMSSLIHYRIRERNELLVFVCYAHTWASCRFVRRLNVKYVSNNMLASANLSFGDRRTANERYRVAGWPVDQKTRAKSESQAVLARTTMTTAMIGIG